MARHRDFRRGACYSRLRSSANLQQAKARSNRFPAPLPRLPAGRSRPTQRSLWHSTATLLHSLGVDLAVIQEILGHSSISITSDIYRSRVSELHADAMTRLNGLLAGQNGAAKTRIGVPIGVPVQGPETEGDNGTQNIVPPPKQRHNL